MRITKSNFMKQHYAIIIILAISLNVYSQTSFDLSGTVVSKSIPATNIGGAEIQIGTKVRIVEYGEYISPQGTGIPGYLVRVDQQSYAIKESHINRIQLDDPISMYELWDHILLLSELPKAYTEYGYQYDIRNDLEEEAQEMINILYQQNLLFHDDFIEAYLQNLLNRVQPDTYNDRRPGHLSIKILSSAKPDSYSLPNGTIIITTGLISLLNSEEELIAILSHEVAHYVFDHQITNYNAQVTREKRAAFWAGVATALAATGEIYMNINQDIYTGGLITASTAFVSTSIAEEVIFRLGIEYSQEQEWQADHVTAQVLQIMDIDSTALSSVLIKMQEFHLAHENYYELSQNGPYPLLNQRINRIGKSEAIHFQSTNYDIMISLVHSHNAILQLHLNEAHSAIKLCNRNIEAGIAMEDDYIIKALAIRQMSESAAGNLEALSQLQEAETLDLLPTINISKQQGITYFRLDMLDEAHEAFSEYLRNLEILQSNEYVNNELNWTRAMIHKVDVLKGKI